MSATVQNLQPISAVGIDHRGSYQKIGDAFGELSNLAASEGWPVQGLLALYLDDPMKVPEDQLRSKACVIVPQDFAPTGSTVQPITIPGGQHAVLRHVGSYSGLGDAWRKVYSEELPRLGLDDAGAPFEIYRNTPRDTPEEALITDICVPVKPRS